MRPSLTPNLDLATEAVAARRAKQAQEPLKAGPEAAAQRIAEATKQAHVLACAAEKDRIADHVQNIYAVDLAAAQIVTTLALELCGMMKRDARTAFLAHFFTSCFHHCMQTLPSLDQKIESAGAIHLQDSNTPC